MYLMEMMILSMAFSLESWLVLRNVFSIIYPFNTEHSQAYSEGLGEGHCRVKCVCVIRNECYVSVHCKAGLPYA